MLEETPLLNPTQNQFQMRLWLEIPASDLKFIFLAFLGLLSSCKLLIKPKANGEVVGRSRTQYFLGLYS